MRQRTAPGTPVAERLRANSERRGECLVWTGYVNDSGYGILRVAGRAERAHRVAWVEAHGPIPPETPVVRHKVCDNRPCIDVEHLALGTHADNVADKMKHGRWGNATHCRRAGHEYTPANTMRLRSGYRQCRACHNQRNRERRRAADQR